MRLIDLITKGAAGAGDLRNFLVRVADRMPDLAAEANNMIELLDGAVDSANLVRIAEALPGEIANIAKGRLDPRDSPSNLV